MKFLGIDYGTKRIGLAISDAEGKLAFPKEIIPFDKDAIPRIGLLIKMENIDEVVVGESLDFSGIPNVVSEKIEKFISELYKNFEIKISREKEFLTSVEARKVGQSKASFQNSEAHSKIKKEKMGKVDATAAALILQRFLDRKNKFIP